MFGRGTAVVKCLPRFLLCILLFSMCNSENAKIRHVRQKNEELISLCISNEKGINTTDCLEKCLLSATKNQKVPCLVCFVDASCSVCIADFLLLAKTMRNVDNLHLVTFIDQSKEPLFSHYAEKILKEDANSLDVHTRDEVFPFGYDLGRARAFLVCNNRINGVFSYSDGELLSLNELSGR